MNTYYIVEYGREYPNVMGVTDKYADHHEAEGVAWALLGTNDGDSLIGFSQVIKVTPNGEEFWSGFEN